MSIKFISFIKIQIVFNFILLYNYFGEYMKIRLKLWVKIVLTIVLFISIFFLYSSFIGTNGLKVKEYNIINSKIPESFYGIKIIQISDIHYKNTTTKKELIKITNEINKLKPDIVLLTGDLLNKKNTYTKKDYNDLIEILGNIDCNINKYAIKGDNDTNEIWEDIINKSNFIDLNNDYELIYYNGLEPILLIGLNSNYKNKNTLNDIYSKINIEYKYSILMLHEPDYINNIDFSKFDLILAGHSLNGSIKLPFIGGIIKLKGSIIYYDEYYKLNNTDLFISGGIGTDKFKLRFRNLPSFNLYRLKNKE